MRDKEYGSNSRFGSRARGTGIEPQVLSRSQSERKYREELRQFFGEAFPRQKALISFLLSENKPQGKNE